METKQESLLLSIRNRQEFIFKTCAIISFVIALSALFSLVLQLALDGLPRLTWNFFTSFPSRFPHKAGILSALAGSFYLMILTALFSFPLGVGAAIYLEEYAPKNLLTRIIEVNIANLAGVPSIIYGLLGLQLFVRFAGLGRSLLAGALTLTLLILPIIIITSREALRTAPQSLREASFALGATQWQTIRAQVLPVAMPGILTGCILAFSRAIGETAPLVTLGALTYVPFLPDGLLSPFTALPIQAFNWLSRPQEEFHANAAAAIIVLLIVLVAMNWTAVTLRNRLQKRVKF